MGGSTKQALLQALSAAEGAYISGQQLAEALGVSRAAVHKAAQALLAQGYALDSAPRRGYRLAGGDPFCAEAVGPYPAPIHIYDTLQSSNLTAKQLALGGAPHGTLVLTAHQQAGRGRLGRRFESPAGKGVYLSLILRPALSAADAQSATISAAVAVARAVRALCGLELGIKWVNDLYYQGRKVCGILTEAGTDMESGQLEWLVVGIGLNLTTSPADWPEELARTAGSLYPGGPAPVSRAVLAGAIARELLSLCPAFDCLDEYRARCFVPGHWVTVCTGAETYAAKALSIDDAGTVEGKLASILFGVPAVKGVEFGIGFGFADKRASEVNDQYEIKNGRVATLSNNNGGVLGGMTDGAPLSVSVAIKPTPSIAKKQKSVNLLTMENAELEIHGRHDPCIVVRAVPVIECAVALGLLDLMM